MLDSLTPSITSYIQQEYFSAVAVGLAVKDSSSTQSWGTSAWGGSSLTSGNLFDLASLTKLYTTLAILRLIEMHKLEEQTKLTNLLPIDNPSLQELLKHLDIAALLTHHSGLPAWFPFYTKKESGFQEILHDLLNEQPLTHEVVYSDLNFMLLGMVVSQVMQLPLDEALQELVLTPLGLTQTTYHPDPSLCVATEYGNQIEKRMVAERKLSFNRWRDDSLPIQGVCNDGNCHYYFGGVSGHAGLFSNAEDVLSFGKAFLSAERSNLSQTLYDRMLHDWGGNRGYGIQRGELYLQQGFGHTGFTGTYLYVNPEKDLVITILTNRLHTNEVRNINPIRIEIVKRLLKEYEGSK